MPVLRNFEDVHQYLSGLMSETRSRREAYTLERMQGLMAHLGNPQNTYKVIHVAGTSGKSSTCYYLSAFLSSAGKKVGLSISPHIDEVNERVQINTVPIPEKEFCRELSTFLEAIEPSSLKPTYFELLVAFAFWEFARQKVDYAVVEVGLGGLLDGTNVIDSANKVCIITDIGYDHTRLLGKDLQAIAAQKAGIILPGNSVFSYRQDDEIMRVLREVCVELRAGLHEILPQKASSLPKALPLFQRRNWHLAFSVYEHLAQRDDLPKLDKNQLAETTKTYIPSRMEILQRNSKTLILDAAHNPQKLATLIKSVKHAYPGQTIACLVGFVHIKQTKVQSNLKVLLPAVSHLIATGFNRENAEYASVEPVTIVETSEALGYEDWELIPDPAQALQQLLRRPEDVLLVTGSFFLQNAIRPLIMNNYDKTTRRD